MYHLETKEVTELRLSFAFAKERMVLRCVGMNDLPSILAFAVMLVFIANLFADAKKPRRNHYFD